MFDRNDPADLASLKSEAETDPIAMGYDINGPTQKLLQQFNEAALNVNGDVAARDFDSTSMLDALEPVDFDAQQTSAGADVYTHILVEHTNTGNSIEPYKAKWRGLFAGQSDTVAALDAQTSPLSRGEVLYGQGTIISREDWFAARDS